MENQTAVDPTEESFVPSIVAAEVQISTSEVQKPSDSKLKTVKDGSFFEPSDYKNGAIHEKLNYSWAQSFTEIEIHIRLPNKLTQRKLLKVEITSSSLKVTSVDNVVILEGEFSEKCKASEAMWTITSGNKLSISVDKKREIWWKRLFLEETEIDLGKVDPSRPMEDLPEETQANLERIRWDEQQKMEGKPTSDQLQQIDMLKKAWDAEGSPFKGTSFDPSILQFQK